jgi:hypothetical protein
MPVVTNLLPLMAKYDAPLPPNVNEPINAPVLVVTVIVATVVPLAELLGN